MGAPRSVAGQRAMSDAEFERWLETEVEAARARLRAAPNPLANVTREDIRRSRASALPEIIGVAPRPKPDTAPA